MVKKLFLIGILLSGYCGGSFAQQSVQERTNAYLPVYIKFSDKIAAPPDSIREFIKTYIRIKGIRIVDSLEISKMNIAETERAIQANYKKGETFPGHETIQKWSNTVAYMLTLSIYNDPKRTNFAIDSIRWGTLRIPINFERKRFNGIIKAFESQQRTLFNVLKTAVDEIIESVFGKKE